MADVSAFATYLCRDETESKDLVQETMLKAFQNIASYRQGTNARAWLFQICRNTFINPTRRKKFSAGQDVGPDASQGLVPEETGAAYVLEEETFGDEVMTALRTIPQDCQTAVLLCDIEGYSYEEIAAMTRTRPGTVRSRIFRGRKALARILLPYAVKKGLTASVDPD